jgi:AbiV family abortive infection protein
LLERKLKQYSGRLSPSQVAEGINAANRNAVRLAEDARLLFDNQRYASAGALAILSIEESGKASILRAIALARSEDERRQHWKDFRSHTRKNVMGAFSELVAHGARHLDDFAALYDKDAEPPHLIDQVKQIAFYTDCLGRAHWAEPHLVIEKALAESLVANAKLLARGKEVTKREIELWIEHLGPVWMGDISWMKKAVANWYAAMHAEGLAPDDPESMARFVWPNSGSPESGDGV